MDYFVLDSILGSAPGSGESTAFVELWGQSNMRGEGTPFPAEYQGEIEGVSIFDGAAYVPLNGSVDNNNQFGQPQGTFGPEMSMLKQLATIYDHVYCYKRAIGSSGLASVAQGGSVGNWNPAEAGDYYDDLVTYANLAIAALPAGAVHLGVFGDQGEGDGGTAAISNLYYSNLDLFVTSYRTDTGRPTLKFHFNRVFNITDFSTSDFTPRVRWATQKYAYDNRANGVYVINRDDQPKAADNIHMTATGYVNQGIRMADAVTTPPANLTTIYSTDFPGASLATDSWQTNGTAPTVGSNKLTFTNDHAGTVAFESGRNCLSRYVANRGNLYARVKMSWTDPVQNGQSLTGFLMHMDTNNYIAIFTDTTIAGGNGIKVRQRLAGVNTDTAVAAVNGDEFKIAYNATTGVYATYYWSGGAWVQLTSGTAFTGTVKPFFTASDSAAFTGGDTSVFENFDYTIEDFTTLRP